MTEKLEEELITIRITKPMRDLLIAKAHEHKWTFGEEVRFQLSRLLSEAET